jgi:hypothetical protein
MLASFARVVDANLRSSTRAGSPAFGASAGAADARRRDLENCVSAQRSK